MMTTEELIALLQKYPGRRVVVPGDEWGYTDIAAVAVIDVHLDTDDHGPGGPHESPEMAAQMGRDTAESRAQVVCVGYDPYHH